MRILAITCLILISSGLFAQTGYKIGFKVQGLKDTTAYLGFFLQERTYIKDTAKVNSKGEFLFEGRTPLAEGVYFLVLNNARLFDFIVSANQRFSLETSTEDFIKNMVVKGDEDNKLFFENMLFVASLQKEADPFVKIVQDSTLSEDQKKAAREGLNKINTKANTYNNQIISQHPKTLTTRLLKMNTPVHVPDPPKKANGNIDSTFQFRYYRQHYFDNFDLGDEAMLRTPKVFYAEKVKDYLDRLFVQHPDTITKAINSLAAIAKRNQETYKYLVWNCVVNYQNPTIMGLDVVYVNLVDKYFTSGEMDYWLDKKTIQNMKEYADKLRRATIGTAAPNLVMQDQNLQPKALYDLKNKYTIVYFFKPSCGHCREETPKLVTFYNANKKRFNLEVFAVSTDTAMQEMKDFIKEMKTPWITVNGPRSYLKTHFMNLYYAETTPTVYITDDKKKIIARRLDVEQIEGFLANYEKMAAQKKKPL
ncbi:TlpA family protein disulfide reductase [Fulvivirgaceae bacterium PWU4]|uniref:TlpA family protein disulfide reductase n=1 Tax=Chryseosolibacter histidini TaxID=2782349 RepID=A0AAP2DSU2_9BACT|nr:TlpA family protein disulfide reductase [Chryseosolibacter histidini]MBT1699869.1 TlpA family protein disulfide reductase [Chryseosolibacter histidini]